MKFALHMPIADIAPGEFQSIAAIRQMSSALEAAQVDGCYVTDHPAPPSEWLHNKGHDAVDPFTGLAFVAATSARLQLLTNILVLPYRNPFLTAKSAATLQVLSEGRLILGVGLGYLKGEFDALGVNFHERGVLADEALEVLRLAWAGEGVTKQGINFSAAGIDPRPIPDPAPPIWVGGATDKAARRAARWGDGWCPFLASQSRFNKDVAIQSLDELGRKIEDVMSMRHAAGKSGRFDVAIGLDPPESCTPNEAERLLQTIDDCAAVGVTWMYVDLPHPSRAAYLEMVEWFGEEVAARTRHHV